MLTMKPFQTDLIQRQGLFDFYKLKALWLAFRQIEFRLDVLEHKELLTRSDYQCLLRIEKKLAKTQKMVIESVNAKLDIKS